jgi:hypothetical protein
MRWLLGKLCLPAGYPSALLSLGGSWSLFLSLVNQSLDLTKPGYDRHSTLIQYQLLYARG